MKWTVCVRDEFIRLGMRFEAMTSLILKDEKASSLTE